MKSSINTKGSLWEGNRINHTIELTQMEYRLLCYLMDKGNQYVSKNELLRVVWRYEWLECTGAVESAIHRLRKKIEEDPTQPQHLITRRGAGYQLVAPPLFQKLEPQ